MMLPLGVVLAFPLILVFGYGTAYLLSGRSRRLLEGFAGFMLYLLLLAIPLLIVLITEPELPGKVLGSSKWTPGWVLAGLGSGLVLWFAQCLVSKRGRSASASPIWVGPRNWCGFWIMMVPVSYIVVAEELVWRGFLMTALGLPLSALAFALHHYHFGLRHIVFAFGAGIVWGGLFLAAGELWPAIVSHLAYNVLAWLSLRRLGAKTEPMSIAVKTTA